MTLDDQNVAQLSLPINAPELDDAPVLQGIVAPYPAQPQVVYVAHYGGDAGLHWDAVSQGPMDAPVAIAKPRPTKRRRL